MLIIRLRLSFSIVKREPVTSDDGLRGKKMAKPVAKFKAGQISSALWENEISVNGRKVTVLKATVQRRYKDKDGQWKSSASLSRNEIPLAIYCLQRAFEKIIEAQIGDNGENGVVEEDVAM